MRSNANCGAIAGNCGRAWTIALLIALAFFGGLLAAVASQSGVGLSDDSFVYLSTACYLSDGQGLLVSPCVSYEGGGPAAVGQKPVRLTHFPPLYPAALAALRALGLDLRDAARWMNVTLFSVNLAIIGFMLRGRCRSPLGPVTATLWMVTSIDLIYLHAMAWSEPLSLALGFGGLILLGAWLEGRAPRVSGLPMAAVLTGFAALTRYAGVVYIGVGALALTAIGWAPRHRRYRASLLFVGIAAQPLLLLALHNAKNAGVLVNRRLMFFSPHPGLAVQALDTAFSWVVSKNLPSAIRITLAAGILLVTIVLCVRIRGMTAARTSALASRSRSRPTDWILVSFVPAYLAFLFVSKALLDYGIPIGFRLLAPVHMAMVPLAALAGDRVTANYRLPRRFLTLALGVLAALLVSRYVAATSFAAGAGNSGLELSSIESRSQLLATVRELPSEARVYSNLPDDFFHGRSVGVAAQACCGF